MNEIRQWYAVRCCCRPAKIFGFLQLPLLVNEGRHLVADRCGVPHDIEVRGFTDCRGPSRPVTELAVYSDERPVEFWRSFPNFMESGPCHN